MENLPPEVIRTFLSFVDRKTRLKLRQASRFWLNSVFELWSTNQPFGPKAKVTPENFKTHENLGPYLRVTNLSSWQSVADGDLLLQAMGIYSKTFYLETNLADNQLAKDDDQQRIVERRGRRLSTAFAIGLKSMTNLHSMTLRATSDQLSIIAPVLPELPLLESLSMSDCHAEWMPETSSTHIFDFHHLAKLIGLKEFEILVGPLSTDQQLSFCGALQNLIGLKCFILKSFGGCDFDALGKALSKMVNMERLSLIVRQPDTPLDSLVSALVNCTKLIELKIHPRFKMLEQVSGKCFVDPIITPPHFFSKLQVFELYMVQFSPDELIALLPLLKGAKCLRFRHCFESVLRTSAYLSAFANAVPNLPNLGLLDIGANFMSIYEDGLNTRAIESFAKSLESSSVKQFLIDANQFGKESLAFILEHLPLHLEMISMAFVLSTPLSHEYFLRLRSAFQKLRDLKHLWISHREISNIPLSNFLPDLLPTPSKLETLVILFQGTTEEPYDVLRAKLPLLTREKFPKLSGVHITGKQVQEEQLRQLRELTHAQVIVQ